MTNGSGALESGRAADAAQLMAPLHEADIAGLLEHLPAGERDILVDSLGAKLDAETYAHLDEAVGENAGTQTLTVVVRALAVEGLLTANALRIVEKETLVGSINGFLFAVLVGVWQWRGSAIR